MENIDYSKIPAGFPLKRGPVVIRDGKAYPCQPGDTPDAICTIPCTTNYVGAIAPATTGEDRKDK